MRGGSLLFVYALGMGVLFFVLAVFAVSLPKSGRWMEWVKSAAGIFMLLAAIYYLQPLHARGCARCSTPRSGS